MVQHFKNITLRVGSTFKDTGGTVINVTEIIAHEKFDKVKLNNDIALLKFDPIEFSTSVQPIELIGADDVLPDGAVCLVSGWGLMEGNKKPRDLHSVNVDIVNQGTCKENYNSSILMFKIADSMLCAAVHEGHKDACSGDSVSLAAAFTSQIVYCPCFRAVHSCSTANCAASCQLVMDAV